MKNYWQLKQFLGRLPKTKGFGPINVAIRRKRNYASHITKETWYIMSNLSELELALTAYSYRMGIEEMFRDWKKGGYNLEGTKLTGKTIYFHDDIGFIGLLYGYS